LPRVGRQLARELIDQRGLARAVGPDDGVDLARAHIDRDRVGHQQPAKALDQGVGAQHRFVCGSHVCRVHALAPLVWAVRAEVLLRWLNESRNPAMPALPSKPINTMTRPNTASQGSVKALRISSMPRKASAPSTGPKTVPKPPSTSITTRSPEMIQDSVLGEAKAFRLASNIPATPHNMADST